MLRILRRPIGAARAGALLRGRVGPRRLLSLQPKGSGVETAAAAAVAGVQSKGASSAAAPTAAVFSTPTALEGTAAAAAEKKKSIAVQIKEGLGHAAHMTVDAIRNPVQTWEAIKKEIKHYWVGTKLLWVEIKIAKEILGRISSGHGMTRRERIQLIRTAMDLFRLVPFAIFVIVPFMELLLPVALKLFPNMLPSTFQDKLKKEESMKMELQMRLAVAGFFQETMTEMAKKKKKDANGEGSAGKDVLDFIEKARLGEPLPNETVIRIAGHFKDELTLANINRPQLVSMCQYMGLQPYGADAFLRFQLRTKLRAIKEDDRRILWEGIDSLTMLELREACQERGMRTIGLTEYGYKRQLQEWLDLSIQKNIPISLLIMSRAFMLTSKYAHPEDVLKSSMSSLDSDTINEVVLAVAKPEEESSIDIKMRKLESIQFQSEMIQDERDKTKEAKESQKKAAGRDELMEKQVPPPAAKEATKLVGPQLPAPVAPVLAKVVEKVQAVTQAVIKSATSVSGANVAATVKSPTAATSGTSAAIIHTSDAGVGAGADTTTTGGSTSSKAVVVESESGKPKELSVTEIQLLGDLARGPSLDREKAELAKIEARVDAVEMDELAASADKAAASAPSKELHSASSPSSFSAQSPSSSPSPSSLVTKDAAVAHTKEADKEDQSMARMQSALHSMVDKLKDRISDTEKALTDKLPILDKDNDGSLSNEELTHAMQTLLKRAPTEQEAEQIVKLLDSDGDGKGCLFLSHSPFVSFPSTPPPPPTPFTSSPPPHPNIVSVAELLELVESRRDSAEVEALASQTMDAQLRGEDATKK